MSVTHRSSSTGSIDATSGSDLTIDKPSGTVEGDLMVADVRAARSITGLPSGWTQRLQQPHDADSDRNHLVAYKVAGASEPGNYTFTQSQGIGRMAGGIDTYIPSGGTLDLSIFNSSGDAAGTDQNVAPSVTATVDDTLVRHGHSRQNHSGSLTYEHTSRWSANASTSTGQFATVQDQVLASAGSSGTATLSYEQGQGTDRELSATLAIQESAGGGGGGGARSFAVVVA